MPRISPDLLRHAQTSSPSLARLLPVCRDLRCANNELRWLREHVLRQRPAPSVNLSSRNKEKGLKALIAERASGKPLQFVLGNQPFGELDILCKPGVLIPRPETEALTSNLASLLPSSGLPTLRILDICSGTGCIALLLHSLLSPRYASLRIVGIDVSSTAIALAKENLSHNISNGCLKPDAQTQVEFSKADIFDLKDLDRELNAEKQSPNRAGQHELGEWDILIANPPYISRDAFVRNTARSVRKWEPRLALVPPRSAPAYASTVEEPTSDRTARVENDGDAFYPQLLYLAALTKAKIVVMEVGDLSQAIRVAGMVMEKNGMWDGCQLWRDWHPYGAQQKEIRVGSKMVRVMGEGNGRAVIAWRGEGRDMTQLSDVS